MNNPGPVFSVVLTSCNQLNALKFTLLSLKDQKPDLPHEILVVDCGSQDGSAQFLAAQAENGVIQEVLSAGSRCRASARNLGAHQAEGRHIMFLDPGIVVGPRWWEPLLNTLEKDPQVGAVSGKIILPDGRIDHAGLALLEWWDQTDEGQPRSEYGQHLTARSVQAGRPAEAPGSNRSLRVQALTGEALMVRASGFFAVGGFSARVGREHLSAKADFTGELGGVDLSLRLGSRGWACVYRHESVMTRLRLGDPQADQKAAREASLHEQEIFNRTWLGRVRGDFLVAKDKGTVPADHALIHSYIEPVISYGSRTGSHGPEDLARQGRHLASVVVVTENNLEQTKRCAEAVLAATRSSYELIFVDRSSQDGTLEYLQEMAAGHPHIEVLNSPATAGYVEAQNQGLATARGRNLVLLSSGAVVAPGWLAELTSVAELHPRAGLVGPVTNHQLGLQSQGMVDYEESNLRGLNSFALQIAETGSGRCEKTTRLSGFCLLIKRELLIRIGGMDERFSLGNYEDNDYCLRAQLAGYHSLVARGCFVHHDRQGMLSEEQIQQLDQLQRQWEIFKDKWGIPREQSLSAPLEMSDLLAGGYRVERHFQQLPQPAPAAASKAQARRAQEALA